LKYLQIGAELLEHGQQHEKLRAAIKASSEIVRRSFCLCLDGDPVLFVGVVTGERSRIAIAVPIDAFPKREGTHIAGDKEAKGKPFQDDILKVAATQGSAWFSYMFPKPGQTEPSEEWAYVKRVTLNGTSSLIATGFYAK